ncbi:MAG: hypothetical protein R3E82_03360 [Pseudomonadales bacterium]
MSACVALYGGWHWFGSSGVGLVVLWLQVRLEDALAAAEACGGGGVSLYLDQVAWVRVDPWRVTVAFSKTRAGMSACISGAGHHPIQTPRQRCRRLEFFCDEFDATSWAQLRRALLKSAAPKRGAEAKR